ncbi:hypothetical protein AB0G05_19820 [Nonomuraea wenchangensis]
MINPNEVLRQVAAAAAALNRVLDVARIERLDVRTPGTVELDGLGRRRINAAVYAMPDGIARTVAVSAWCVFAEVLAQSGRGDMANLTVMECLVSALTDHAHMIEGASAAQVVETAMREGAQASARSRGKHRS